MTYILINVDRLAEFRAWGDIPAGTSYYDIADVVVDAITNQLGSDEPLDLHGTLVDALDQIRACNDHAQEG